MSIASLACGAAALGLVLAAMPAAAAIVVTTPSADITAAPYTITFQPGESLSFSNVSATTTVFEAAIGVQTTGAAEVFSTFGQPDYFQTFARSLFPAQQGGSFEKYSAPTGIPYSLAEGLVGFEYMLSDGVHYGFADIGGSTVYRYFLETAPGQNINLGVPEPSTWAMLLTGLGLTGSLVRRRHSRRAALAG